MPAMPLLLVRSLLAALLLAGLVVAPVAPTPPPPPPPPPSSSSPAAAAAPSSSAAEPASAAVASAPRTDHRHLSAAWSTLFGLPGGQRPQHGAATPHRRRHQHQHPHDSGDEHASCPSCGARRAMAEEAVPSPELTALRIEFVKQQILKKLRLKEPPVVSRPSALPKPLALMGGGRALRHRAEENNEENFYGRTDQVILFPTEDSTPGACPGDSAESRVSCFVFKLPGDVQAEDVTRADLWLYRQEDLGVVSHGVNASVQVAEISNWDLPDQSFHRRNPVAAQSVERGEGWVKVDFVRTVKYWLEFNVLTNMIETTGTPIASDASHRPFIVIYTNPVSKVRRPKRNARCVPGMAECCRDNLYVSFKEIGWDDWILQPMGYEAYFCRGSCTTAASLTMTGNHHNSIIRKLMQTGKRVDLVPCCTPTKYSEITLLYLDNNQTVIQKTLPNMVVEACGCN